VYAVAAAVAVLLTAVLTLLLVRSLDLSPWVSYLLAVNTTTLLAYGYDKAIAGGGRQRVPEGVLQALALFGGTPGALAGQLAFRHKTRKSDFRATFFAIVVLQVVALAAWLLFR
jgi:uncharacterized membrane protein YsdA (DUF1294 family)